MVKLIDTILSNSANIIILCPEEKQLLASYKYFPQHKGLIGTLSAQMMLKQARLRQ